MLLELFSIENGMTKWTFLETLNNRSRLEYFLFFILNYQLDRDINLVQVVFEEILALSTKEASKYQMWISLFMASYLMTYFVSNITTSGVDNSSSKSAIDLAYKFCCLFYQFNTRDTVFKQPKSLIQLAIHSTCQSLTSGSGTKLTRDHSTWVSTTWTGLQQNPFLASDFYLNEADLNESISCLLIERLFVNDYDTVIYQLITSQQQ